MSLKLELLDHASYAPQLGHVHVYCNYYYYSSLCWRYMIITDIVNYCSPHNQSYYRQIAGYGLGMRLGKYRPG